MLRIIVDLFDHACLVLELIDRVLKLLIQHKSVGDNNDGVEHLIVLGAMKRRKPVKDVQVALSTLVAKLNERFGTDFTDADQLFFDQVRATAEQDEEIVEAAQANNFTDFSAYLDRVLEDLFIDRMEGNEAIFSRVMGDKAFRQAAQEHIAKEIYERVKHKHDANAD